MTHWPEDWEIDHRGHVKPDPLPAGHPLGFEQAEVWADRADRALHWLQHAKVPRVFDLVPGVTVQVPDTWAQKQVDRILAGFCPSGRAAVRQVEWAMRALPGACDEAFHLDVSTR